MSFAHAATAASAAERMADGTASKSRPASALPRMACPRWRDGDIRISRFEKQAGTP
jgi:hypothetical protein